MGYVRDTREKITGILDSTSGTLSQATRTLEGIRGLVVATLAVSLVALATSIVSMLIARR